VAGERVGEGFFVNPSWQQLTGQNENEMSGLGWLEPVHPDDRERTGQLWEQAMLEKRAYENELRVRIRDGSYRHFYIHAVPILAPDGNVRVVGANTGSLTASGLVRLNTQTPSAERWPILLPSMTPQREFFKPSASALSVNSARSGKLTARPTS
jgi:PAS domain S-box-containing protein